MIYPIFPMDLLVMCIAAACLAGTALMIFKKSAGNAVLVSGDQK